MVFNYRAVQTANFPTICSFATNAEELFYCFPKAHYPLTPEQLAQAVNSRSDSTVVLLCNQVVGFANFYQWEQGTCVIGNVMVSPHYRGQGVARFLMSTMGNIAKTKHNAHTLKVSCFNTNTSGLILYKRLGFQPYALEERTTPSNKATILIHLHKPI